MKAEWDRTRLTVKWWHGERPRPGDGLRTRTGRQYLVLAVCEKALDCLVIPRDEKIEGRVFDWEWAPRRRRRTS